MKSEEKHWTWNSESDLQFAVAYDFITQIERYLEEKGLNQDELARRLEVSPGRVSQILNNPQRLSLSSMTRIVRALGVKFTILAYDDRDSREARGPVNSSVFISCWEAFDRPKDAWELEDAGVPCHEKQQQA